MPAHGVCRPQQPRSHTVTRFQLVFSGLCIVLVLLAWQGAQSQTPSARATLPGARPDIDASQYSSLQAALDALPATGGVVRIPAGTFEIKSPLRITQEDVLLEGAGTATHIKNVNSEGKPAIHIGAANLDKDPK